MHPLLELGYEVHVVGRRSPADTPPDVRFHFLDLFDGPEVERVLGAIRPEALLHLAWEAEPGHFWTSPLNFQWVEATLRLARIFAEGGGRRFVGAGTCAEYDWAATPWLCDEGSSALGGDTPYGLCKRATYELLTSFATRVELSVAWGRVFFPYGPHEGARRLVPSVALALLRDEPALCSHGRQVRDFMHVADVAEALVAVLASELEGAVNVASGLPVRLADVVETIAGCVGRPDLVRLGALPEREGEPPRLVASVARLRDEVGWAPRFDLTRGIGETVEWWRRRGA
jgi:nucleoside-diphosphate-sugar epimerase